jgi:hypothetical protein
MSQPFIREFKLGGAKGNGVHPYLNEYGAFLGDGTPLLEKDSLGRWQPRARPLLERSLSKSYRARANLDWRMDSFAAVARALNKGNRSLAAIALVHAELPPLPNAVAATRIANSGPRFAKEGQDVSNEPRVPAGQSGGGQWTDGGGGGAIATSASVGTAAASAEVSTILLNAGRAVLAALVDLGATLSAPITLAIGLVLIPTSMGGVSEGSLPGNPDIKYRRDERELTIWQEDTRGNRTTLYSGFVDTSGLYRDTDGNVIGRDLGGSVALNGPAIAAAAAQMPAGTINERRTSTPAIPDTPECKEEWDYAEERCERLRKQNLLGMRGYARTFDQCLRGFVSERCGGNPIE